MFRLIPLLSLVVGLTACQLAPKAPVGVLVEMPLEVEPLPVPQRTEITIARITEMLSAAKLTEAERARLLFERGVLYDSVGLAALARYDFMRALQLQPDIADVYNFIGIHHILSGDFNEAYEAFDAVLDLQPDHPYAYLNRAIAFLYDGKLELAIADFRQYQQQKPTDPYPAIWLYLAEVQQTADVAKANLQQTAGQVQNNPWGRQLIGLFLGEVSEQQLLAKATEPGTEPTKLTEQLCEAYFYLAQWHLLQNNPTQAAVYFKRALATNVYEFVEHKYARLELDRLRQQVVADGKAAHAH
jgi:lipoprotein NlpI